jgi:hypothetical protein
MWRRLTTMVFMDRLPSTLTPAKADVTNLRALFLEDSFDSPHFGSKETSAKPESARAQQRNQIQNSIFDKKGAPSDRV